MWETSRLFHVNRRLSMTRQFLVTKFAAALFCLILPGAVAAQSKDMTPEEHRAQMRKEAPETVGRYKRTDAAIDRFFRDSAGYAVFPRIGKAGFIIGGGHGAGEVYEKGRVIGTATITMATVGLQAGVQEFSEIIFFENQAALDRFKQNKFEFTA